MEDRLSALEQNVLAMERRLADLEKRLDAKRLAGGSPEAPASPPGVRADAELEPRDPDRASPEQVLEPPPGPEEASLVSGSDFLNFLTHSGRSLIVLGGAYLLRALTENGALPAVAGVSLGLAYSVLWLLAAGRAASSGRKGDATFHGLAATAIAFPLIFEATLRFHFLSPLAAAVVLALLAGLSLGIAWWANHQILAWIHTLASLLTATALLAATGAVLPFGAFFIVLGLSTLWLGYEREWTLLRWLVALAADFVAVGLVLRALTPEPPDPPRAVVGLLLALVGTYLASFATRTLLRGRDVVPFEIAQTAASLFVGLGGAVVVARSTHAGVGPLGAASLLLGIAAYTVAHAFLGRTQGRGLNFQFYATLALVFVWVGLRLLLTDTPLALVFGALALVGTWLEADLGRDVFRLHGFLYLLGAAWVSGLLGDAGSSILGDVVAHSRASGWVGWILLLLAIGCSIAAQWRGGRQADLSTRLARLGHVSLMLILLGAVCIDAGLALSRNVLGRVPGPGGVATLRTVVFASASVVLAASTRRWTFPEMRWVAWILMGGTGLKIVVEDLRQSGPALLFIAFATCGIAFILVPRLLAKSRTGEVEGPADRTGAA